MLWSCSFLRSLWANLLPTKTKSLLQCNELLLRPRGSHMQALATGIKVFDLQKVCLIVWSFTSEALEHLIFKGSKVKLQPCVLDLLILAVQRSPWSAPQKGFDHLIQFWSRSQTLLHGTYKWLTLVILRSQLDRIPHVFVGYYDKV